MSQRDPAENLVTNCRAGNYVFLARSPTFTFFWLPKRVNRDISCIATKVRKLQIYPFSFQHTRLEYRPPLASKIQMEIHDTHIYVEHIYIYMHIVHRLDLFELLFDFKRIQAVFMFHSPDSSTQICICQNFGLLERNK